MNIKVTQQGAPVVNDGDVYRQGSGVVALEIDLKSKYCEVSATAGGEVPGIFIDATARSLHHDESQPLEASTFIEFPEYKGWSVWSAWIGRYTLSVCLVKDEVENRKVEDSTLRILSDSQLEKYGKENEKNLEDIAHEIWAASQLLPNEGIEDGVGRVVEILNREYP